MKKFKFLNFYLLSILLNFKYFKFNYTTYIKFRVTRVFFNNKILQIIEKEINKIIDLYKII